MIKLKRRIGSAFFACMMMLSLLPVTALASNTTACSGGDSCTQHEAAIGSTHYDTIGEAIDAANKASGSGTTTIKLLRDAALTGGEQSGYYKIKYISKNITLDLGTHTLTYNENGGFAVNPNCHFTIQNGTYINTSNDPYAQAIEGTKFNGGPGCTITIAKDAVIQATWGICADGYTTINVYGTIISSKDGIFGSGPRNNVTLDGAYIEAGVYGVYQQSKDGGSTYTIKNSTITTPETGETCAVFISNNKKSAEDTQNQGRQTLIIENSVISGQDGIEVMYTDVTISGEKTEVTAAEDGHALGVTYYEETGAAAEGTLNITGGTFNGDVGFKEPNNATLTISGGKFTVDVRDYLSSGMMQDESGNVVVNPTSAAASIDGVYYLTLAEAIAALKDGDTMLIMPGEYDVTTTGTNNQVGSYFILDEDNVTIKAADPANKPVIYGFSSSPSGVGNGISGQNTVYISGNNVTLENLKIMPLAGVNNNTNEYQKALEVTADTTFTMTGCEFVENSYQYNNNKHNLPDGYAGQVSLNIPNGTAETVKITDCIFTGAVLDPRTPVTVDGCTFDGASPVHKMAFRSRYQADDNGNNTVAHTGTVITNSKFLNIGEDEIAVYGAMSNNGAVGITASGNYWGDGATQESITDMIIGKVGVANYYSDEAMKTIVSCNIQGMVVNNATYLSSAIAAAKDGDTIVLANDITIPSALDVTKDITIDGNNHTITADKCVGLYIKDDLNYLTVKNLTLKGVLDDGETAGEGATGSFMGIGTYNGCYGVGKLTLTDVTIDGFSYGLYFGKNPAGGTGNFNDNDVTVDADNLTIQNCYIKGAYFEKLTDSSFTDCQFLNNGADPKKVQDTFQTWMSGVDINLKNGSYQNIVFDGCTFKGNGANQGTALLLKARDDGSYGADTKLDGVTVTDCIFTDNNSAVTPIIIGEKGKNNKSPVNVSIQDGVAYTNNLAANAVYIVTFKYDGNTTINTVLAKGDITLPAAPSRAGYSFRGWYDGHNLYAAGEAVQITKDTTFVAQWSDNTPYYTITVKDAENGTVTCYAKSAAKGADVTLTVKADVGYQLDKLTVTDASGNVIDVEKVNNTTYTFVMPGSKVTVEAIFAPTSVEPSDLPFTDVSTSDWFYGAVKFVYENGLMDGVGNNLFAPNATLNRAMAVTILYRLEGSPAVTTDAGFNDVAAGTWYTDAVNWAAANNIVNGVEGNNFDPTGSLTREQMATVLYRYAQYKGADVSASGDLSGFVDSANVSSWAADAVKWAVGSGLVNGVEGNALAPQGTSTRAQAATVLMRFVG